MKPRIWPLAFLLLSAGAGGVGAASLPANDLFARADQCVICAGTNAVDLLCCPSKQFCNMLAANTTVLCCDTPNGCENIKLIPCDINVQNPKTNPSAQVKTTALNGVLERCGKQCCPFGYSCNVEDGESYCKRNADQNAAPIQTTPSSSTAQPTSSTTNSGTSPSSTSTDPSRATVSPVVDQGSSSPSTASIIGGVVGGILGLAFVGIVACICLGRRRRKKREHMDALKFHRSTSSFGNIIANPIISKPIVDDSSTMRTDFNRKSLGNTPGNTPGSSPGGPRRDPNFGGPARRMAAPASNFSVSSMDTTITNNNNTNNNAVPTTPPRVLLNGQVPPIRQMRNSSIAYGVPGPGPKEAPSTPLRQREPSLETLKVFADPQTVGRDGGGFADRRLSNFTTFSNLMEQADLGGFNRGEPYVPPGAAGGAGGANSVQGTPASKRWRR
ncbi:uncharacterized protein E0L32_001064 [Thyridium curvatum]|uniref:Mid2 domain-containing protein n=1 Tax=Thyridium curvatum TaxID=1093900 RepID=A0A507AWY2_9PEZI|nr:uncharacterized protein E0L32_001064 [Thyridium curvatum]TPX11246.1 hypothetical protein E0L32_001064 [Thyridium curvatum]